MIYISVVQSAIALTGFILYSYRFSSYMGRGKSCICISLTYFLAAIGLMVSAASPWADVVFISQTTPTFISITLSAALTLYALATRGMWADGLPVFFEVKRDESRAE